MWFRKASARRQAIREDVAEVESLIPALKRDHGHIAIIAAVFFLIAAAVQFWPTRLLPYRVGERAKSDIRSPVSFQLEDPEGTLHRRELTREVTLPVIVATPLGTDHIVSQLNALKQDVQHARNINELPPELRARFPSLNNNVL
jgi:hypothetical protein